VYNRVAIAAAGISSMLVGHDEKEVRWFHFRFPGEMFAKPAPRYKLLHRSPLRDTVLGNP
jgi:hypothetical protein